MKRHLLLAVAGAVALALLAVPAAHADVWANVGPASPLGGLASRWPLGSYALDEHFTAISAGVLSGVDVSGLLPTIAWFFANELWQLTSWLANLLIELFGFAFSLDLVNGSSATNGAGALGPVSRAIQSIYSDVFGGPWMVLAVSVAGMWAMWKALVQRRYAATVGQLGLSLIYVGIAFLFVLEPGQTIGTASHWTNEMSGAFLSISEDGEPASQDEAKEAGADQLFGLLVAQPWAVLEFGGLDHCVRTASAGEGEDEPESVAVQPLPDGAARRLESGEQVSAGGKTCIDNLKKYGPHFLRFESGSDERDEEFEALSDGDGSKLPDADPGKKNGSYELGPVDRPAAAAMEKGGQYQRLLVATLVFFAELGAFCLLGALSVGVITAQILLLLLLAFSPVALVAAAIPGRGHQFFKGWLSKLAGLLLRKAAYSLVLAVLLAVCAAISSATSELGWLMSFGLQCAFFWAVFLQRRSLTEGLVGAVTGPGVPGGEKALGVLALYSGARLGTRTATRPVRAVGSRLRRHGGRGVGTVPLEGASSSAPEEAPRPTPDRPDTRQGRPDPRSGQSTRQADPEAPAVERTEKEPAGTVVERPGHPSGSVARRTGKEGEADVSRRDRSEARKRRADDGQTPPPGPGRPGREGDKIAQEAPAWRQKSRSEVDARPDRRKRKHRQTSGRPAPTVPSPRATRPDQDGLAGELRADAERAKAARRKPGSRERTEGAGLGQGREDGRSPAGEERRR
jgi:hypothetical protein